MATPKMKLVVVTREGLHTVMPPATIGPSLAAGISSVRVEAAGAKLRVDLSEQIPVNGRYQGPGPVDLAPGSLLDLSAGIGVVVPTSDKQLAKVKQPELGDWEGQIYKLWSTSPVAVLRLGTLGIPALLAAVLFRVERMAADGWKHQVALFRELLAAGLESPQAKVRKLAEAAGARHRALLDADIGKAVDQAQAASASARDAELARARAFAEAHDPEHDGGKGQPTLAWDLVASATDRGHGWWRGASPLTREMEPRSRIDGEPMTHLCTLLVPREYRPPIDGVVALACFQDQGDGDPEGPFVAPHPRTHLMVDAIDGEHALVWLTAEELAAGPRRVAGSAHKPVFVGLRARLGDPGAGKTTNVRGARAGAELLKGFARSHFGGTSSSSTTRQPPRYLELEEHEVGANYGGGAARIDLTGPRIRWGED